MKRCKFSEKREDLPAVPHGDGIRARHSLQEIEDADWSSEDKERGMNALYLATGREVRQPAGKGTRKVSLDIRLDKTVRIAAAVLQGTPERRIPSSGF